MLIDINDIIPIHVGPARIYTIPSEQSKQLSYKGRIYYKEDPKTGKKKPIGYYISNTEKCWIEVENLIDKLYQEVYNIKQKQYLEEKLYTS